LFARFLRFGFLAWGGPVAQIAMIKKELVEEERWISFERFNRALAVYQVLPGPEAHELCVYFGMLARGRPGAVVAGLGFMLPGLALMLALSWAYVSVGFHASEVSSAFAGVQAAVVALVVRAVHRIGKHGLVDLGAATLALASFVAGLAGAHFALILGAAALLYPLWRRGLEGRIAAGCAALGGVVLALVLAADGSPMQTADAAPRSEPSLAAVTTSGLKAGLLTFGGAYTAVPLLQHDAVVAGKWLTNEQFMDGIALGGVLPAPLVIFATFVGFVAAGWAGALLMTFGIFLPAFLFTLVGHGWFERVTMNPRARIALDGVVAAVIGLIAAAAVSLGSVALSDVPTWFIFGSALAVLIAWSARWAIPAVILGGAVAGWALAI
jgi:chromate transporter